MKYLSRFFRRAWAFFRKLPLLLAIIGVFSTGAVILPRGIEAVRILWPGGDPTRLVQYRLNAVPNENYVQGIKDALDCDDVELAESIFSLAEDRGIAVPEDLHQRLESEQDITSTLGRYGRETWSGGKCGHKVTSTGLAIDLAKDFTVIGDVQDLVSEARAWPEPDYVMVALAGTGVMVTGATYASGGGTTPVRIGVSIIKATKKIGTVSATLMGEFLRLSRKSIDLDAFTRLRKKVMHLGPTRFSRAKLDELVSSAKGVVRGDVVERLGGAGRSVYATYQAGGGRAAMAALSSAESINDVHRLGKISNALKKRFVGAMQLLPDLGKSAWRLGKLLAVLLGWSLSLLVWFLSAAFLAARVVKGFVRKW